MDVGRAHWWKVGLIAVAALGVYRYSLHLDRIEDIQRRRLAGDSAQAVSRAAAKAELDRKEYVAKRRRECFDIYDKEKKNWSNTSGMDYDEEDDECRVMCKNTGPQHRCVADSFGLHDKYLRRLYLECKDNVFSNVF